MPNQVIGAVEMGEDFIAGGGEREVKGRTQFSVDAVFKGISVDVLTT